MRFSIATAVAFALVGGGTADPVPGVSPAEVVRAVDAGKSFDIDKLVQTSPILPKPEIVLLIDVTGSMAGTIENIKTNLKSVIETVTTDQPAAKFAVVSFGDLADPNGFTVHQDLTSNVGALQTAVDNLKAEAGGDTAEDWIYALHKVATGSVSFSDDSTSSRIVVLVGDATSHDPSGGISLGQAIDDVTKAKIRVIGVDVGGLDSDGKAHEVTSATGGIIIGSDAKDVSAAIVSGLKALDVTIKPSIVSCDDGLSLHFSPSDKTVNSGSSATFLENVKVASSATKGASLTCTVEFLVDGVPGGPTFVQKVIVQVNNPDSCFTCDPHPGKNKCHITTSCTPTPYGTMCLTRPGLKADGADDDDTSVQWRLNWNVPGHEHRIAVKPGTSSNTLCSFEHVGNDICKEVSVAKCKPVALNDLGQHGNGQNENGNQNMNEDQKVMGNGDL
ncbi:hypothetical protein QBC35DRAFT_499788 [Podospora australis]|uniref:VWFA domain-containing protein n=1 Tax=Podospora australis TaxID=1536484 RepID=A0AAN6WVG9_9PEZI|nr:hypothetical protein QBC35DRAFT_499788 [Podospora australis]